MNSSPESCAEKILHATGLQLAWSGRPLFDGLHFSLQQRELVALLGKSGCGKTTLLQLLGCLIAPDSGQVFARKKLCTKPGHAYFLPQQDSLMPWLRLEDNLLLPLRLQGKAKDSQKLQHLLGTFDLVEAQGCYPYQMSGGMRQRAALLRAHLSGADILLLDEPLASLDAITRRTMQRWLAESLWNMGTSAVLVTHDVEEALLLGDRLFVMGDQPAQLQALANPLPRHQRFAERYNKGPLQMAKQLRNMLKNT